MRAGAISGLRAGDVNGSVARLKMTKNGFPRNSPACVRYENLGHGPKRGITTGMLDTIFRAARVPASIDGLAFHDTRHEAITRLAGKLNGIDLARTVNHYDIKHLQTYYNPTAEDIAKKL